MDAELMQLRVRWIELAAASPILTCLISFYVEGDRGHLIDAEAFQAQYPIALRGNAYSFMMPWEDIVERLGNMVADDAISQLPWTDDVLARVVLFKLRIGNVADLSKWLPVAKLRPRVVLKLMFSMYLPVWSYKSEIL